MCRIILTSLMVVAFIALPATLRAEEGSIYGWGNHVVGPTGKLLAIAVGSGHNLG